MKIEKLINLVYPPTCGICGKLNSDFLCKKCEKILETEAIYGVDKTLDKYFNEHLYIFLYQGIIRRIILKYKFQEEAYLYKKTSLKK